MGKSWTLKAYDEFKKGNYKSALDLYEKLKNNLKTDAFDFNINKCRLKLPAESCSQQGSESIELREPSLNIKNKGLNDFFDNAVSLLSLEHQNLLIYVAKNYKCMSDKEVIQKFRKAKERNCKTIFILNVEEIDLEAISRENEEFDEVYIRPFKATDQFWINYVLNCNEFKHAIVLNPNELRGASRIKTASLEWNRSEIAQFGFANGIFCAGLFSYSLLKENAGFLYPFQAKYSSYEFFCRLHNLGFIAKKQRDALNKCISFHENESLSLEVLKKWIESNEKKQDHNSFHKAIDDPRAYRRLPLTILESARDVTQFYSDDTALTESVKLFCFSEYLERAGITGKVKKEDIFTLDDLERFSVYPISNFSSKRNELSIINNSNNITYVDLLPLRNYQVTDIECLKSKGKIPLAVMVPVIKRISNKNYGIESWEFPDPSSTFGMVSACFNNSKTIISSLISVLGQSIKNLEITIVDDCSTDGSLDLVNGFLSLFPYVQSRIIVKEKNSGVYPCRNSAIIKSRSEYLFGQDLDDFSTPQRVFLSNLFYRSKNVDFIVCNHARMDSDFNILSMKKGNEPLKTYRKGLMTWQTERNNFFEYGMFLSVRKSGDSEIYDRLKRLSKKKVFDLDLNLYYALMDDVNENRLTADIFKVGQEKSPIVYRFEGANSRFEFEEAYKKIHKSIGLDFNFRFGKDLQSERNKIIGNMATIPGREEQLVKSIQSLLPQIDQLNLFLNGDVDLSVAGLSNIVDHEKVRVFESSEIGDLRDNAKFYCADEYTGRCYYLTFDDDLIFPVDYVDSLLYKSKIYDDKSVITVHGYQLWDSVESIHTDKKKRGRYYHFKEALYHDIKVDIAGTGTVLVPPGVKIPSFNNPPFGMVDIVFANYCSTNGIDIISIDRPQFWIQEAPKVTAQKVGDGPRLYLENQRTDRESLIRKYLAEINLKKSTEVKGLDTLTSSLSSESVRLNFFDKSDHLILRNFKRKVYICCTGYNYAGYAIKFARSLWNALRASNYDNVTVLAYDDCSDDGSAQKLRNYFEQNLTAWKWQVFEGKENKGPAYGRSFLFDQVVEEDAICIFLDSDDEVEPGLIRRIVLEYLYNPDTLGTFGGWKFNDKVKKTWPSHIQKELTSLDEIIGKFKFGHPRSFVKSVYLCADKRFLVGPDGNWLKYCSDLGLYLAILSRADLTKFRRIDDVLYRYNVGTENGTINRFGSNKAVMRDYLFSLCSDC